MNRLKIFAVALVAMAAIAASAGAGSASATTLCKQQEEKCAEANRVKTAESITATLAAGTKIRIKAGIATFECSTSTIKAAVNSEGGAGFRASAAISTETIANCGVGQTVEVKAEGELKFEWAEPLGTGYAYLTSKNSIVLKFGGEECVYGETPEATPIMVNGSATAPTYTMTDAETELEKTGGAAKCNAKAKVNATYNISSPTSLWVVKE
jgi:hypothetical protein